MKEKKREVNGMEQKSKGTKVKYEEECVVFFVPFIKIQMEQSGVRDFNEKAQENTHYIIFRDLFVLFVFFSFWFISCFIPLHYK
mmetsp:Transcript_22835/g.46967  ORF Transcript_22835/g.46967 Transcript_22835/m.46967 type:complete len:84 (+) Transcript_22835:616-867(+)